MSKLKTKVEDPRLTPFERLTLIMKILRSPEGCSWDRKQTHKSLIPYLIEEAYEVAEAIEQERYGDLREELGDLLCQAVFHAQLASERDEFTIEDSVNHISDKLIRRHPHVFGERKDLDPQQVRDQWETIKTESGEKSSVFSGLPHSMPALNMAFRIGEKAGGIGFDWKKPSDVLAKLEEELAELKAEIRAAEKGETERITEEIGDLLFAVASLARKLEIDPERALKLALAKFRHRFDLMEQRVSESGRKFGDYSLEELESIWQAVKTIPESR